MTARRDAVRACHRATVEPYWNQERSELIDLSARFTCLMLDGGVVGFSLPDTVDPTAFELCAPTQEHSLDTTAFPCVPVKAADDRR
ncbi:hypothetical protein ABTY35_24005 [Streptomyces fimicarius]|uniref:hypothetical protein n=1 Tax=Streptomyces griseus TaxID=1911 RepID=UPI00332D57BC